MFILPEKIARCACFSHTENFLIGVMPENNGNRCQLMAVLKEYHGGNFHVEITNASLDTSCMVRLDNSFETLGEAMDWIAQHFYGYNFSGVPDVLYLPEWAVESETNKAVQKWADQLFGLKLEANAST